MEYKFSTFYHDKLQQCHIDTFCNLVSVNGLVVGNLRPGGYMYQVIPVYMFTGMFDENDNEIYEGHKLKVDDTILIVKWNIKTAGFCLTYEDEGYGELYSTFVDWDKSCIVGHIGETQIKESVNESAEIN